MNAFRVAVLKLFDVFLRAVKAAAMTSRISHTSVDAINAYAQSVLLVAGAGLR